MSFPSPMAGSRSWSFSTVLPNFRLLFRKIISLFLVTGLLALSSPAAPGFVVASAQRGWGDLRFDFLSGQFSFNLTEWLPALFFPSRKTATSASAPIDHITIFPGSVTVSQNTEVVFSAIAYDANNEQISRVPFEWQVSDLQNRIPSGTLFNNTFQAFLPGTFTVTAQSGGRSTAVTITVMPISQLEQTFSKSLQSKAIHVSSRSGEIAKDSKNVNDAPATSNLLPGETWDETNYSSADDPGNRTGNPPGSPVEGGAGNGNFSLSAPVVALPGRGIDLALSFNYNSRLWNKAGTQLTYNIDRGYPAPGWSLGFGQIAFMGLQGGCLLVDADGTRHGYAGTVSGSGNPSYQFYGHTTDGTFIDYNCWVGYGTSGTATAQLPNGTVVDYAAISADNDHIFPVKITDAQGNYITITYRNNHGPALETVTDTTGRTISFQYDANSRLISATAPRMQNEDPVYGSAKTRTLFRLHYRPLTLAYSFAPGFTTVVANATPNVIDAIYYPSTSTGYWFGADPNASDFSSYYSSYGMISKVVEQRGMGWTTGPEEQGTVTAGSMTKQASYNYPLTTANETGHTNGVNLSDAPTYETLTESWAARDVEEDTITTYKIHQETSPRTTTVLQPNGSISKQYAYKHDNPQQYDDGLVYLDETYVPDPNGTYTFPELNVTGNYKQVAHSNVTWAQGEYGSPRPTHTEIFDEKGKKVSTDLTYTGGRFNQIVQSCDRDDGGALLRCADAQYETSSAYIGSFDQSGNFYSGRHVFNLVTGQGIENPDATKAAWTEYEYDVYTNNAMSNTPNVVQHSNRSDPYTSDMIWVHGDCLQWYQPPYGSAYCVQWNIYQVPAYDSATDKRGNITKVKDFTDAQAHTGEIDEARSYDITGNMVRASASCCEQISTSYDDPNITGPETQYAYPISQTHGSSDVNSPNRITTYSTWDMDGGVLKTSTDANGRLTTTMYNPDTIRPVKVILPTGAYTTADYDDSAMTITEQVFEQGGNLADKSIKYLNGLGLEKKEESYTPSSVDIVETKYTKFAEEWKQSRPYRSGDTVYWSEKFYDTQGRLYKVTEPDGSETKAFFNETQYPDSATLINNNLPPGNTIRVMDAWGRERWGREDQQGRLAEVVEPNPDRTANATGSIFDSGSLVTKYTYDTIGRLTQTEQGQQLRKFKYDSLGRLTRQKLAEQTATLNDSGAYIGPNQTGANWDEAFVYDDRSNLTQKTDARGVRTNFSYQMSGADDPLNRIQSRTYDLSGPLEPNLTINSAPTVTYSYMTSGDKMRIQQIRTAGFLTEDFLYDTEGRASEYKQTVDYRTSYPMTVGYLYDSLDRVKETYYPAQYGITGNPRKTIQNTFDTASRLSSLKINNSEVAGTISYNASDQTTAIKIGPTGTYQVTENYTFDPQTGLLTNQTASNGTATLLNLDYDYGRNNSVGSLNGKTGHVTKILNNLDHNKDREYEFDVLGRLTKAKGGVSGALWNQQYAYDRYGNRTSVTASGVAADNSPIPIDGTPNLSFNNTSNRITTAGFDYDYAGNQIRALADDGVSWVTYEYDAANRLQVVRKDDHNQTMLQAFQYGSTNARLIDYDATAGLNKFYCSANGSTVAEYTEYQSLVFTWTKSNTYLGDSQLSTITPDGAGGETTEYDHPDRIGTRKVTNQQQGTNYEQTHLPFGKALAAESTGTTTKRFTSYERSAPTGLDYAVNRTFDSKQGRFTQIDPEGIGSTDMSDPQSLNLYTYCTNDPINYIDPSGLGFFSFIKQLFHVMNKILKWLAIVVVVVLIAAVVVFSAGASMPAFLGGGNGLLGILGSLFGHVGAGISSFMAGAIGVEVGTGVGFGIASALYSVGAIATSFMQTDHARERQLLKDCRIRAMLDAIAPSEGNSYGRVVYGKVLSAPGHPELVGKVFSPAHPLDVKDFSHHPNYSVRWKQGKRPSTAAGRYQFLIGTWNGLGLKDFTPESQDIGAVILMERRRMIDPLLNNDPRTAILRGNKEWASLPGSPWGQRTITMARALRLYRAAVVTCQKQNQ